MLHPVMHGVVHVSAVTAFIWLCGVNLRGGTVDKLLLGEVDKGFFGEILLDCIG